MLRAQSILKNDDRTGREQLVNGMKPVRFPAAQRRREFPRFFTRVFALNSANAFTNLIAITFPYSRYTFMWNFTIGNSVAFMEGNWREHIGPQVSPLYPACWVSFLPSSSTDEFVIRR